ncbi:MAG: hypothetical protein EOP10_27570 [Proteobacteria bacterium]|nr:MAG: hypothetical protein EOP10_27570 [Pseudomonadota bacterium]
MNYSAPLLLALCIGAAFGCQAPQLSTTKSANNSESNTPKYLLSLNDVAILVPFKANADFIKAAPRIDEIPDPSTHAPGLSAAPADGEAFVPAWALTQVSTLLKSDEDLRESEEFQFGGDGFDVETEASITKFAPEDDSGYRLVSLRIDPCANPVNAGLDDTKCVRQLRLIFQEIGIKGRFFASDNNVHAIYQVTDDEMKAIAETLRSIAKNAQMDLSKEPLLPHPVLSKEGPQGDYYKGVLSIIHRFARASKLTHLAFFADVNGGRQGHWPMLQFAIKDGKPLPMAILQAEQAEGEAPKFVQRQDGGQGGLLSPSPASVSPDTIFPEFAMGRPHGSQADFDTWWAKVDAIKWGRTFAVEHPIRHDPTSLDCASCHNAFQERRTVTERAESKGTMASLVVPLDAFKSDHFNLSIHIPVNFDLTSLQMFSYFRRDEKITQRVVNDAAVSADYLNEKF